ncbi:sulfotransferase [uncultured Roseobacter sp.]|uniref:sulfotransferase family protein n=1 Tax=uncultured Roseobacter sp. TaxID=114847 RepID=UPI0026089E43|nr:sulfotransferase [uncultured Roseobacter sp.]
MTDPGFIIIGAMKCGTSTLQVQLAAQDGVFMTDPKEPNYFSDDDIFAKGPDWYAALFAGAGAGDLTGEASTHYTKLPTWPDTVARLHAAAPDVKLIYMIRNPVDRAVSQYIHEWSTERTSADITRAFADLPEITAYGQYGMQITPFAETFGREALMLTSLEQFRADPQAELARIGDFLGLASPPVFHPDQAQQNVSAQRVRRLPLHGLLVDSAPATFLRRRLIPKALRTRIRKARTISNRPDLPDSLRSQLEATYTADRDILAGIFPGHPALTLCYPFVPS